jgi:hypothetical protein
MKPTEHAPAGGRQPGTRYRFYGDQFLLDTVSGNFYRVTATAGFILRAILDGADDAKLVNLVEKRFKISHAKALRDVELFQSELRSLGIIEPAGVPS